MKTRNEIRNTTAEAQRDPTAVLALGVFGGNGRAIEASEARGQAELVRSEVLPAEMSAEDRKALEAWGIVLGEPVEDDALFTHAILPASWKKEATDHSMWSDLVDDKGRKRAGIFYKAAFYDRKAHLSANCRYSIGIEYPEDRDDFTSKRAFVKDCDGSVLFDAGWMTREPGSYADPARSRCEAWLDENRPGWKDPALHWDDAPVHEKGTEG